MPSLLASTSGRAARIDTPASMSATRWPINGWLLLRRECDAISTESTTQPSASICRPYLRKIRAGNHGNAVCFTARSYTKFTKICQSVVNLRVDSFAAFHYLFCRAPVTREHEYSSSGSEGGNTLGKCIYKGGILSMS